MEVCFLMVEKAPFGVCYDCTLRPYSVKRSRLSNEIHVCYNTPWTVSMDFHSHLIPKLSSIQLYLTQTDSRNRRVLKSNSISDL